MGRVVGVLRMERPLPDAATALVVDDNGNVWERVAPWGSVARWILRETIRTDGSGGHDCQIPIGGTDNLFHCKACNQLWVVHMVEGRRTWYRQSESPC